MKALNARRHELSRVVRNTVLRRARLLQRARVLQAIMKRIAKHTGATVNVDHQGYVSRASDLCFLARFHSLRESWNLRDHWDARASQWWKSTKIKQTASRESRNNVAYRPMMEVVRIVKSQKEGHLA